MLAHAVATAAPPSASCTVVWDCCSEVWLGRSGLRARHARRRPRGTCSLMLSCSARVSGEALTEPEGAAKDAAGALTSLGARVSRA